MRDTVIILLVNAVTTIIVTVVTVRFTMTGRVVSQNTKDKLKAKAARYGVIFVGFIFLVRSGQVLGQLVASSEPVTRIAVFRIAVYTWWCGFWFVLIALWVNSLLIDRWWPGKESTVRNNSD